MFSTAPVDGHWGRWSSWTSCSAQCGPGTRSRVRSCDDPMPKYGGKHCIGEKAEKKSCVFQSCGLGKTAVLGGYLSDVKLSINLFRFHCIQGPNDCQFEEDANGLCTWTQDDKDEINWIRSQGPTPSSSTGPVGDHTSGGGIAYHVISRQQNRYKEN
jgi:hypothetical protein